MISWVSACPVKFFAEEERSGFNRGGQQYPMKEIKLLVRLDWPLRLPAAVLIAISAKLFCKCSHVAFMPYGLVSKDVRCSFFQFLPHKNSLALMELNPEP